MTHKLLRIKLANQMGGRGVGGGVCERLASVVHNNGPQVARWQRCALPGDLMLHEEAGKLPPQCEHPSVADLTKAIAVPMG